MGAAFAHTLAAGERVSIWCAGTAVVCCLVVTLMAILGLGVGLGYNHCFIDMKTRYRYVPAHYRYEGNPRWSLSHMKTDEKLVRALDDDLVKLATFVDRDITEDPNGVIEEFMDKTETVQTENVKYLLLDVHDQNMKKHNSTDNSVNNQTDIAAEDLKIMKSLEAVVRSTEQHKNNNNTLVIPMTGLKILDLLSKFKGSNYTLQINYT